MVYLAWQLLEGLCNLTLCLLLISKFIYVLLWHPRPIQIGSFLKEDKKIGDTKLNLVQQESFSSGLESFWSALQLKQTHFSLRNWAQQIQSITIKIRLVRNKKKCSFCAFSYMSGKKIRTQFSQLKNN